MQVFKAFFRIAKKNLPSSLVYVIIFAGIMLMFVSTSQKDSNTTFEAVSLNVYVIDHDKSDASSQLIDYLSSMHTVTEKEFEKESLLDDLYFRTVGYILEIPDGFETDFLTGTNSSKLSTYNIEESYNTYFLNQQINSFLDTLKLYIAAGNSISDAGQLTLSAFKESADHVSTLSFSNSSTEGKRISTAFFFQYLGYILLLLLITGLSPILITFKDSDLEKRMICSSLTLTSKNIQTFLGSAFYSMGYWLFMLLLAFVAYGNTLTGLEWFYSILNSFVLLLIYITIAFFISCICRNLNYSMLSMIGNTLSLGMGFLCGIFVTQDLLGTKILAFSRFLPTYWYVRINNMISGLTNEVFTTASYWKYLGIEFAFAVAIFAVTLMTTKIKNNRKSE